MKRILVSLLLLALTALPSGVQAAIGFGNAVANSYNAGGGTLTVSGTVNAGCNEALVAEIHAFDSTNITSVTWNGVSLTQEGTWVQSGTANDWEGSFYLLGPTVGTFNLVINRSDTNRNAVAAVVYTGVKQSGQPDATNSGHNTGLITQTSASLSLNSVANNAWHIFGITTNTANIAGTANVTSRNTNTTNGEIFVGDSNSAKTPAGSVTQSVSFSASTWSANQFTLAPATTNCTATTPFWAFSTL